MPYQNRTAYRPADELAELRPGDRVKVRPLGPAAEPFAESIGIIHRINIVDPKFLYVALQRPRGTLVRIFKRQELERLSRADIKGQP